MRSDTRKRGFGALLVTQFLGAFNDNAFKIFLSLLVINRFVSTTGNTLFVALAGVIFVLPYLLFSMYAGFIADRFSKQRVIIVAKVAEVVVMVLGLLALYSLNITALFGVLFLMGAQSAFFSPAKYGIVPEILEDEKLSEGNGSIQLWTYAASITGTACGGFLYYVCKNTISLAAVFFIGIALIGVLTSLFVTKVQPSGSQRLFRWNFIGEIVSGFKVVKSQKPIFLAMAGLIYFGFVAGLFQLNILLYARKVMGVSEFHSSILLTAVALGLGLGSLIAGKLSGKRVEFGLVPLGAIGLTLFSILLGFIYASFLSVVVCLFLLGIFSGFYIIPLTTFIQQKSPVDRRGQILATNNSFAFLVTVISSTTLLVLRDFIHLNSAHIFVVVGVITIAVTMYICRLLPEAFLRFVAWSLTHTFYRIKVIGKGNIPNEGGALLAPNHISYVDALLISAVSPRPIRFMVNREIYNRRFLNPLFKISGAVPIAYSDSPKQLLTAIRTAREAVSNGELVCIFPEGMLTRTGNILKFNKGIERIMKGLSAPIIPVHLDRVWGSIFSFERNKYLYKIPKAVPYSVTVSFGETLPSESTVFEVRNKVLELSVDAFNLRLNDHETLAEDFLISARKHPFRFCMADSNGRKYRYGRVAMSTIALASKLQKKVPNDKMVGVMLPPSIAGAVTNIALSILNKTSVNLNYTLSSEILCSIATQYNIQHIVTSRAFLIKTGIALPTNMIFIEDLVKSVSLIDKIYAAVSAFIFSVSKRKDASSLDDVATVIFTSGSTGIPKGVMLTHRNILANIEGLSQVFPTQKKDVMLGALPFFHSFGYTATLWYPLINRSAIAYHVNPLEGKAIGQLAEKFKATILMTTPTFLLSYIHRCEAKQFENLRLVFVGAEKLKSNIAGAFKEKFGIEPMEGYGCTELSPITAVNLPDYTTTGLLQKSHKNGSIGRPLPGIAIKIVDQTTGKELGPDEDGLLLVKGVNVMKGYLDRDQETRKVLSQGWYNTGDIAHLDDEGFLTITDRLSRFSKIGGEMVPHIKVEEKIHEALKTNQQVCVVTSIPDDKRGERLAVLHTNNLSIDTLLSELNRSGIPKLWIPQRSSFHRIDAIPMLGSGKIDLGRVKLLALELTRKECLVAA